MHKKLVSVERSGYYWATVSRLQRRRLMSVNVDPGGGPLSARARRGLDRLERVNRRARFSELTSRTDETFHLVTSTLAATSSGTAVHRTGSPLVAIARTARKTQRH